MRRLLPLFTLLLTACTPPGGLPAINFVGMSSGTLATPASSLVFKDHFNGEESSLVGVVAFDHTADDIVVQATWFSPDDSRMPLGRTQSMLGSGASVVRFSFARSGAPWDPAPYMLDIRAWRQSDPAIVSTGAVHFVIGTDSEMDN